MKSLSDGTADSAAVVDFDLNDDLLLLLLL